MNQLATRVSSSIGPTVVDRTDVNGIFDVTGLDEQLGLRLESQRAPVEKLVIDRRASDVGLKCQRLH
jgi:hypothetical protein